VTQIASDRANESHFDAFQKTEHHETLLTAPVGSTYDVIAIEDKSHVLKVDLALLQRPIAFCRIESDTAYPVE
jgi:hypothetical protein